MTLRFPVAALLFCAASTTLAGPAGDEAERHFHAIAKGNIEQLMSNYGHGAILQWVGGPLDGLYTDESAVRTVWTKFLKAQGRLKVAINNLHESTNPKGASVTANVEFSGKNTIKVRYLLTYRQGKIVNEVWQIDPNLGATNLSGY